MDKRITYGQMKDVLTKLGFKETRRASGIALEHVDSNTLFLFRPYRERDKLQPAEIFMVKEDLEAQEILDSESFDALLTRTPA